MRNFKEFRADAQAISATLGSIIAVLIVVVASIGVFVFVSQGGNDTADRQVAQLQLQQEESSDTFTVIKASGDDAWKNYEIVGSRTGLHYDINGEYVGPISTKAENSINAPIRPGDTVRFYTLANDPQSFTVTLIRDDISQEVFKKTFNTIDECLKHHSLSV